MKICPKCLARYDDEQDFCSEDGTELRHIHVEDADDKMLGRVLDGRWLIEEKIGEGGMGAVYRGQQTSVGRKVAVKTLRGALADTEEYVERFFREANVASTLNHPHCVTIYDFGQDKTDHVLYLAMEFLEGRELGDVLHQGALPLRDALTIGIQVCSALAAAHQSNVVHRDLKPDNIFLVAVPGGEIFVKVLDYGIAKNLDAESSTVTRTGQIFGTPAYMSPEQCQSADVDPRSDLYSLGVILYELVSGRPPFGGETPLKTLLAHVNTEAKPPSKMGVMVPEGVESIIMRLLAKDPDERFQAALDVRAALEAELDALPDDALDVVPTQQMSPEEADSLAQTLPFESLAADGGQRLVDLEGVQRATTDAMRTPAPTETADPLDEREPVGQTGSSRVGLWVVVALVLAAAGGAYVMMKKDVQAGAVDDAATTRASTAGESDETTAGNAKAADPSRLVALEIAAERLHRAVAAGADAQRERAEAAATDTKRTKKSRVQKRRKTRSARDEKGNSPLLPVLTQAGARRVIASHNDEITACFEKGLLRDPNFGGEVEVRTVIAADGKVANADVVSSTVDAKDVESCVVSRVESWTFPETGDGRVKVLTTPFRFEAPK